MKVPEDLRETAKKCYGVDLHSSFAARWMSEGFVHLFRPPMNRANEWQETKKWLNDNVSTEAYRKTLVNRTPTSPGKHAESVWLYAFKSDEDLIMFKFYC